MTIVNDDTEAAAEQAWEPTAEGLRRALTEWELSGLDLFDADQRPGVLRHLDRLDALVGSIEPHSEGLDAAVELHALWGVSLTVALGEAPQALRALVTAS